MEVSARYLRSYLITLLPLLVCACSNTGTATDGMPGGGPQDGGSGGPQADLQGAPDPVPEISCTGLPAAGPPGAWRHEIVSGALSLTGAHHRGIDLIASTTTSPQRIRGEVKYGPTDSSLEDENVDVFACKGGSWERIGTVVTDSEGGFELDLNGAAQLSAGQRPMYLSVVGDRTGALFLAFVAPAGTEMFVSDVDGTLTTSENAFPDSLVTGAMVPAWDGSPEALGALLQRRYHPVYLTSRGRVFTDVTRTWLRDRGFPQGPLRLASALVTLPGTPTVQFKADEMNQISAAGMVIALGIGNRATDAQAYQMAKLGGKRIYLKLPEFQSEDQPIIDAGGAVGFTDYRALLPMLQALPLAP